MTQETQQLQSNEQQPKFKPSFEPLTSEPNNPKDHENDLFGINPSLDEDVLLERKEGTWVFEDSGDHAPIQVEYERIRKDQAELHERFGDDLDLYYHYYILGIDPSEPDTGDYSEFYEMATSKPAVKAMLDEKRAAERGDQDVAVGIEKSAPELLRGALPPDQEQLLANREYILGVNQSGAATVKEALEYVNESQGIDLGMYNLQQRFKFLDRETTQHSPNDTAATLAHGYYGNSDIFRYVIAVPMDEYYKTEKHSTADTDAVNALDDEKLPPDFLTFDASRVAGMEHGDSVSPKYIAGFIDGDGNYHANKNFTKSEQFELATSNTPNAVE